MFDIIKKIMLTGVGLAAMTKDKVEELAGDLAKKGKLSEKEGKKLVDDLLKTSEKAKDDLEKDIEKMVKNTMKKMNLARAEDLSNLTKQVKKLEQALQEKDSHN